MVLFPISYYLEDESVITEFRHSVCPYDPQGSPQNGQWKPIQITRPLSVNVGQNS